MCHLLNKKATLLSLSVQFMDGNVHLEKWDFILWESSCSVEMRDCIADLLQGSQKIPLNQYLNLVAF